MGEQPSTSGLWLQGVTATPGHASYGAAPLGCFPSAERKERQRRLEESAKGTTQEVPELGVPGPGATIGEMVGVARPAGDDL